MNTTVSTLNPASAIQFIPDSSGRESGSVVGVGLRASDAGNVCSCCGKGQTTEAPFAANRETKKTARLFGLSVKFPCCCACLEELRRIGDSKGRESGPDYVFALLGTARLLVAQTGVYWRDNAAKVRETIALAKRETEAVEAEIGMMLSDLQLLTEVRNLLFNEEREVSRLLFQHEMSRYEARRAEANRIIADPAVRARVFERDWYACRLCGVKESLSVDHIVPVLHGGGNSLENLQTLCTPCNSRKGSKLQSELDFLTS